MQEASMSHPSPSATIRARLKHPVIDSDGHMIEFEPGFLVCTRINP